MCYLLGMANKETTYDWNGVSVVITESRFSAADMQLTVIALMAVPIAAVTTLLLMLPIG